MGDTPLGLAVAAGMLATVNPCGFALLPAYLSFLVIGEQTPERGRALARALVAAAAMTAGFAAVFGLFGLAITPIAGQIQQRLPWVTVGIGMILMVLGGWLLAGRDLPGLRLPGTGRTGRPVTRTAASMAGFGVAYALASLSCTAGPFLAIVVTSFRAGSAAEGGLLFLAYAAGMGMTVAAAALAVALARDALVTRVRRAAPILSRLGGLLLLIAGAYVAYYGWWENRVRAAAGAADPVIDVAAAIQRRLAGSLAAGGTGFMATLFALLVVLGLVAARLARRKGR